MRWKNRRSSSNIEDRRGQSVSSAGMGGGGVATLLFRFLPILLRTKIGRIILLVGGGLFVAAKLGVPVPFLSGNSPLSASSSNGYMPSAAEEQLAEFTSVVLADTEDTWHEIFRSFGQRYEEPALVLFSGAVQSACGAAKSAMGPFYCPADKKVYIDLSFYSDLKKRHNAPGDFAQAYVIAHEVGHHIQTITGISAKVRSAKSKVGKEDANKLSVKQELQADCFAGIWGFHADKMRGLLEPGDLEEALTAASAIGDDRLQTQARGYVTPESFTHGTSKQRVKWFKKGFQTGKFETCDTFSGDAV